MNRIHVTVVAAFALLAGVGTVAAAPGSAPTDAGQSSEAGPPTDLPEPVPDFVTDLLGGIDDALSGSADHLGEFVRAITPGGPGDAPGS